MQTTTNSEAARVEPCRLSTNKGRKIGPDFKPERPGLSCEDLRKLVTEMIG